METPNGPALSGKKLEKYWRENYDDSPPIGYILRQAFPDRWFRIHTLPYAKRYPESGQELAEILRRHNALLSAILGEGDKYVLITTGYSNTATPVSSYPELEPLVGHSTHWLTLPLHELEGDAEPNYWHFFFSERTWTPQSANELLRLVAEDVVSDVLFLSMHKHRIYHPYDGGADVFAESESLRSSLEQKHESWLSSHPEGL